MEALKVQIKEKRNISENSLNTYLRNLRILNSKFGNKEFKNLSFLNNFKKVKDILNNMTDSTRKNNLASILVGLKATNNKNKVIDKYVKFLDQVSKDYNEKILTQRKSDKESENWTSVKSLQGVLNKYASKMRRKQYYKKSSLTKKEMDKLKTYLVLSLYLIDPKSNPPRRLEYASLKITKKDPDSDKGNYLRIFSRNKKEFIFNNYKTAKTYKKQIIPVGSKLNSVINLWLKFNPDNEYLLTNSRGGKMTENGLGKYLQNIFKKELGKKISVNMIRHIILSDAYKDVPKMKEMKDKAEKMGHSVNEALTTYTKK
jgi:hypothetical protein